MSRLEDGLKWDEIVWALPPFSSVLNLPMGEVVLKLVCEAIGFDIVRFELIES